MGTSGRAVVATLAISFLATSTVSGYNLACFFSNWAGYRQTGCKFEPLNIDPFECTHLLYGYGNINANNVNFQPSDSWADLTDGGGKGYYEKFNKLKEVNPELTTLLAMGGGADDPRGLWEMAADEAKRKTLINRGIAYIQQHGFDGIDLSWRLPSSNGGSYQDRENIGLLITEMVAAFREAGLTLTATIPPVIPPEFENAYDYHAILEPGAMDFISVATYDYHGAWEAFAHHTSPLYAHPRDADQGLNTNASMLAWTYYSARDPSTFLLTVSTGGRGFALEESTQNDYYDKVYGAGMKNKCTETEGFMGFLELCMVQSDPATENFYETTNEYTQVPHYIFNDFQWWGFDSPESAARKAQFVKDNGYGGVMLETLELDDFYQVCGLGANPIGTAVHDTLGIGGDGSTDEPATTEGPTEETTEEPDTTTEEAFY